MGAVGARRDVGGYCRGPRVRSGASRDARGEANRAHAHDGCLQSFHSDRLRTGPTTRIGESVFGTSAPGTDGRSTNSTARSIVPGPEDARWAEKQCRFVLTKAC